LGLDVSQFLDRCRHRLGLPLQNNQSNPGQSTDEFDAASEREKLLEDMTPMDFVQILKKHVYVDIRNK